MSIPKKEKTPTYREYLKASAPVNKTGKNRYGVSHVRVEKIPKKLHLNKESVKRLEEIAQSTGLTQSEVVHNLLINYDKYRAKD